MLRYGFALAAVMVSTTAFAQDSHQLTIDIEASTGVNVTGDVSFQWMAPPPGSDYSPTPDGGNQTTVNVEYTSDGNNSGIDVSSDIDFETEWGITVTVDAIAVSCGFGNSFTNIGIGSNQIIDLAGAGSCSEIATIEYAAEILDPMMFSSANSGASATVTYTMF